MKHIAPVLSRLREVLDLQAELLREIGRLLEALERSFEADAERKFYTVRDAAQLLSIGESTLRRLVREGKIRGLKVGGRIVIPVSEVVRLQQGEEAHHGRKS